MNTMPLLTGRRSHVLGATGLALFFALLALPAGCGGDRAPDHWAVRDSAGIRIVEHQSGPPAGTGEWSLSDQPVLNIRQDESDPEAVWTNTRSAFWWDDGRIGVLVTDAPYLRVFDPEGRPLQRLAHQGEGPGELRAAVWAAPFGDSVAVRGPAGLSIYDPAGEFTRHIPAPPEGLTFLARSGRGWIGTVAERQVDDHSQPEPPPRVTAEFTAVSLGPAGGSADTIATFEQLLTWRVQSSLWGMLSHAASDGQRVHAMHPRRFEITTYGDDGITRIVRAPVPSLGEFTGAHLQVTRDVWGPIADRMIDIDREAGRLTVPPAVSLKVDGEGRLWVRRTDDGPAAEARVWDVFDESGVWTATLSTPPQFNVQDVRDGRVLGIWKDETDVTSIRVYRLVDGL